jgi:ethanolamine permease
MSHETGGVSYTKAGSHYFEQRGLKRYAGIWSLWALGVGAVISGHFSGWNFGFATGGWGGVLVAGIIIAIMYLGLVFCIAEMSPALPHTGAAYSFARTAMGPWGGFITGLCENVEYVVTPAVIAFFIGAYLGGILGADVPPWIWWIATYVVFLALNIFGVALSFRVTLIVTLASLAVLIVFWFSAFPNMDFSRWALNIAPDGSELPEGNGPLFPMGVAVFWRRCRSRCGCSWPSSSCRWRPKSRSIPSATCRRASCSACSPCVSAFMIVLLNPAVVGVGAHKLGTSGEPLLDGFRAIFGEAGAVTLGVVALLGLIASFTPSCSRKAGRYSRYRGRAIFRPACRSPTLPTRRRISP